MEAIHRASDDAEFDVYTSVPDWFFRQSLGAPYRVRELVCDVGLVQRTPLVEDLDATLRRLDASLPFAADEVESLARTLQRDGVRAVICDIAPLGIAVAAAAGIPSVLVENFTWDWIYEGYAARDPRFLVHANYLAEQFAAADHRIQCKPHCVVTDADLVVPPVARPRRQGRDEVRQALDLPADRPLVMLSMGGIPGEYGWLDDLASHEEVGFVVPGVGERAQRRGNLLLLPQDSGVYHPDLVAASDAVVGKLGYSTVAEVYRAGVPFGFVGRTRFREAPALAAFARRRLRGVQVSTTSFKCGLWIERVGELLDLGFQPPTDADGADLAARYVLERVLDRDVQSGHGPVEDRPYEQIRVGDRASFSRTITAELVDEFAQVTGDVNPIHVDAAFAAASPFGERIAHGMLAASLLSTVIGTRLPGVNAVYLGQEIRFVAPTRLGDTLTAECEVVARREDKPILTLRTTVTRQDGVVVVEGQAVVKKDGARMDGSGG